MILLFASTNVSLLLCQDLSITLLFGIHEVHSIYLRLVYVRLASSRHLSNAHIQIDSS